MTLTHLNRRRTDQYDQQAPSFSNRLPPSDMGLPSTWTRHQLALSAPADLIEERRKQLSPATAEAIMGRPAPARAAELAIEALVDFEMRALEYTLSLDARLRYLYADAILAEARRQSCR